MDLVYNKVLSNKYSLSSARITQSTLSVIYENQIFKVIDRESMLKLWRQGFFGKGILSRSEPTWEKRTITRLNLDNSNNGKDLAMEDITKKRREERKFSSWNVLDFKLELKKRQGIITDEEVEEMNKLGDSID